MLKVLLDHTNGYKPIKMWCDAEPSCETQAVHLAALPFAYHHVAIMADAHMGYGMPIGGVLATQGVVIPNAVGVDIGCGMATTTTSARWDEVDLHKVMHELTRRIPTGFNHHKQDQPDWLEDDMIPEMDLDDVMVEQWAPSLRQIGTLGGGNHFLEAQKTILDGALHFMVHSGSRNIGFKVAAHFNKLAVEMNERWHTSVPKEHELAFLPLDSDEGHAYMEDMGLCLAFAKINRRRMLERVMDVMDELGYSCSEPFDIHHNYAALENHFGKNVVVHRKGAVRARLDETVIIPGSMGSHSYIAAGLGSRESFTSCSHGAGRKMGRKAAIRAVSADMVKQQMIEHGVELFTPNMKDIAEESVFAYKDIDLVMERQEDLVRILEKRTPLAVIKA